MTIKFTKMHGLGNDFVIIDGVNQTIKLSKQRIAELAARHVGIGFDQLLIVEPAKDSGVDFNYRIYNADGSEAQQCGNGARCIARFIFDHGLCNEKKMMLATQTNHHEAILEEDGEVCVNMQAPILEPAKIPFKANKQSIVYPLRTGFTAVEASVVSMGNPHCVLVIEDVESAHVDKVGAQLSRFEAFPEQSNVGFMQVLDRNHVKLRVYERGTGETLACGSGACAAVVAGRLRKLLDEKVSVTMPGGTLTITWAGDGEPVWMKGPAVTVYHGEF